MNDRYLKKSIVYLNRSQLEPHPDNPRKDLGDLEELRESIRENGIMQNLTVIPTDDTLEHFRILIGHRRYAASEGIENELPCVIVEGLSDKEQLSIMLCENMQRSDLTYIEQAHGFQLMLDLGDTVEEIAHKTGFSETTVKHRLKINELDQNSISEASEYFQLSISDFIKLEKVKDIEVRNRILADARNSSELAETVQDYLEELEHNKKVAEIEEVMTEIGWKKSENYLNVYSNGWSSVAKWTDNIEIDKFDNETAKKLRALAQKEKGTIYYRISWRYLEIARKEAKKKDENKKKTKEELRREEMDKKSKLLEIARRDICDEYLNFLRDVEHPDLNVPKLKPNEVLALAERLFKILDNRGATLTSFSYLAKAQYKTQRDLDQLGDIYKIAGFLRRLMLQVWKELATSYSNKFVNYYHEKNQDILDAHLEFYDILHLFGLTIEKDLKDVINGTSELYLIDGKEVK